MVQANQVVEYNEYGGTNKVSLTVAEIKRVLCTKATDVEAEAFMWLCYHQGLNPFVRDAYLIKYSADSAATMVVGRDVFTKRAEAHPQYAGLESGVSVLKGDKLEERQGTLILADETLVGGWCRVYRTDRTVPYFTNVNFGEYSTSKGQWNRMPGLMIEKVAMCKALRTYFPDTFRGLYDEAEMGDINLDEIRDVPKAPSIKDKKKNVSELAPAPDETEESKPTTTDPDGRDIIIEDVVDEEPTAPKCEDHDTFFQVITSATTGVSKWCHQLTNDGGEVDGWCVYNGDVPVPDLTQADMGF